MANNLQWNVDVNLSTDNAARQFDSLLQDALAGSESAQKKLNSQLGGTVTKKLALEVDSNLGKLVPVTKTIYTEFEKIAQSEKKRQQLQAGSLTSLKGQLRQATQVRDQMARINTTTNKYGQTVRQVNAQWSKQNKVVQDLNKKIADASGNWMKMIQARIPGGQNIMSMANGLTQIGFAAQGVIMAFQAINQAVQPVINRVKQVQGLQLAFEGFGLTAEQAGQFMNEAKVQALTYGASLTQLEKGYKRVGPAIMNAGGSMKDVGDAMASISARTTTLGLNTEQTGRYIEAFAQVMGKGKLQGEELNQQFSELDGALRGQIASYLEANNGITDLAKAMEKGEVTADMFLEAFNAISTDMRENLAGSIEEVQSRLDDMNVAQIEKMKDTLNSITLESLAETLGPIGQRLQSIFVMWSQLWANLATTMPATKNFLTGLLDVIGFIAQGIAVGLVGAFKFLMIVLEMTIQGWTKLINGIRFVLELIPGVKQLFDFIGQSFANGIEGITKYTDSWLALGEGTVDANSKLSELDARLLTLQNRFSEGKITLEEYNKEKAKLENEVRMEQLKQELAEVNELIVELKDNIKTATAEQKDAKSVFDSEKEKLDVLKESVKQYFDDKKTAIKEVEEATKLAFDKEIEGIKQAQEAQKARHEAEMANLQQRNEAAQNAIQAEIDALGQKTPAEEKLQQLRKQEIMDKLRSGELTEKEKLQLQAQLERMQRQKQIEEAQLRLKAEKENAAKAEAALAAQQKEEAKALKEEEQAALEAKKEALAALKEQMQAVEAQEKRINEMYEKGKETIDLTGKSFEEIVTLVDQQVTAVNGAEAAYDAAGMAVDRLKTKLEDATRQSQQLNRSISAGNAAAASGPAGGSGDSGSSGSSGSSGGSSSNRRGTGTKGQAYGGGKVAGGEKWTVNELGREGFMDLSGKMREINAPAWGSWKAPSSGTIIPAHIWSSIKAQSAGSGPVITPSASTGSSHLLATVKALGKAGSNDIVTNNVTIQTDDPDRTLTSSLLAMRRTKRARYY